MLRSIRWRLVLSYVLLAVLTVTVMGALSLWLVRRYVAEAEVRRLTANAEAVAGQVGAVLQSSGDESALRQLASTSAFLGNARVRILDSDREVVADSGARSAPEGLLLVWPSATTQTGGIDAVSDAIQALSELPAFVLLPRADSLAAAADEGARGPDLSRMRPGAAPVVVRRWEGGWGSRIEYDVTDGSARTTVHTPTVEVARRSERTVTVPIAGSGEQLGFVEIGGGPDIVSEALRTARRAIAVAGGGAIALAIAVGLLVSRGLSAPLQKLTEAAGEMSGGNLSVRASVDRRDEIGRLASQFNQMAGRLEEAFAQLASERDALRRFIGDASHELRTPITALKSFNELLRGAAGDDVAARDEFLAESAVQIERLEWITRNLLDLSRLEAGLVTLEKESHDLADLLTSAASPFRARAKDAGIELLIHPPAEPVDLTCDRPRLELALGNLIDNALKFTPAGGQVEVGGRREVDDVVMWVRDTGVGIAAADLPHVFDRFYRGADSGEKGAGLGLAIVNSIVRAHGGRVTAQSSPGEGSAFGIELPQA